MTRLEALEAASRVLPRGASVRLEAPLSAGDVLVIECESNLTTETYRSMSVGLESMLAESGARVIILANGAKTKVERGILSVEVPERS